MKVIKVFSRTRRYLSTAAHVLGDVAFPANPDGDCRFHTRCPDVFARCRSEAPEMYAVPDCASRCFLVQKFG